MLSWECGEGVGDVEVDGRVGRVFCVTLLHLFVKLVSAVGATNPVLVFAGGRVYLFLVCFV